MGDAKRKNNERRMFAAMKNATHFALVMLALLQGHAFAGDSSFEKPEGVVPSTGAGGAAFKTPQRISVFAEEANATSVGKAPLTRKAFRELVARGVRFSRRERFSRGERREEFSRGGRGV